MVDQVLFKSVEPLLKIRRGGQSRTRGLSDIRDISHSTVCLHTPVNILYLEYANHVSLVLCGPLHIPQRVGSRLRGCTSGLSSSGYVFRTSSSGWYAVRVINRRTPFTVV